MLFGPQRTLSLSGLSTGEFGVTTNGANVWIAWVNSGSGAVQVIKSTNYGLTFGSPVTVDTNAANFAVVLNESFVVDPVTGYLYLMWERNEGQAGLPPSLYVSKSTDGGATWGAPVTVDNGSGHANNRFYRIGLVAFNNVLHLGYTSASSTVFTSDGLWHTQSTDGGATWSAPALLYSGSIVMVGEPNSVLLNNGDLLITWYDPGVVANQGGDLYCTRGTWSAGGYTFPGSSTRVTTGQVCGRPRPTSEGNTLLIVTNTNYGGAVADAAVVRSTDGGATWGSVVTLATHTTGPLDHPDVVMYGDTAVALWIDQGNSVYNSSISTDGGASWSIFGNPFTTGSSSDAPRLRLAGDTCIAYGNGVKYSYFPIGAPDPANTATTIIDNFNRADENPLSAGGTWSLDLVGGPSNGAKLVGNQATRQQTAGTFDRAGSYRNDISVSGNYECFFDIAAGGNGETDLILADESVKAGYRMRYNGTDFTPIHGIDRIDPGSSVNIGLDDGSRAMSTGDKVLLRLTANYVAIYRNTGSGWVEVSRAPDTTYRSGLRPGFNVAGFGSSGPVIDNFGGNALNAPSNTVVPTITGTIGGVLSVSNRGTWATASGATPTRYTYKWQSSPAGTNTWSDIDVRRAVLPTYDSSVDATKDYRCVVTATNAQGPASVNSNTLSASSPGLLHAVNHFNC